MTAEFTLEGLHIPVLRVEPERGVEEVLMAAFLRFDSNVFSVYVERREDGHIESVTFKASQA